MKVTELKLKAKIADEILTNLFNYGIHYKYVSKEKAEQWRDDFAKTTLVGDSFELACAQTDIFVFMSKLVAYVFGFGTLKGFVSDEKAKRWLRAWLPFFTECLVRAKEQLDKQKGSDNV